MKKDASTSIEHMHYLDVPASGSKDFKLAMYFYKEGATQMKVCIASLILCFRMFSLHSINREEIKKTTLKNIYRMRCGLYVNETVTQQHKKPKDIYNRQVSNMSSSK